MIEGSKEEIALLKKIFSLRAWIVRDDGIVILEKDKKEIGKITKVWLNKNGLQWNMTLFQSLNYVYVEGVISE